MTSWLKLLLPLLSIGFLAAEPSLPQQLPVRAELLESELALAKASPAYVLIDISDAKIILKARGITLREWNIPSSGKWGYPCTLQPRLLLEKSAFLPPQREEIKPGEARETDDLDLQALELSDMPESFSAILDGGIRIRVKPSARGAGRVAGFAAYCFNRLFNYPLRTIISSLGGKDFPVLELELESGTEVQAFYWALREDTSFLVFSVEE